MNHVLPTLLMLSLSMNACGQELSDADVPQAVKATFQKQFPGVAKVKWELEDRAKYEANFHQNGTGTSATFDASGSWLETETEVKETDLPAPVRATLAARYAGYTVSGFERVQTPEGLAYELEAEKGERTLEVQFAADGAVLKQVVEEETKDDEKD